MYLSMEYVCGCLYVCMYLSNRGCPWSCLHDRQEPTEATDKAWKHKDPRKDGSCIAAINNTWHSRLGLPTMKSKRGRWYKDQCREQGDVCKWTKGDLQVTGTAYRYSLQVQQLDQIESRSSLCVWHVALGGHLGSIINSIINPLSINLYGGVADARGCEWIFTSIIGLFVQLTSFACLIDLFDH